MGGNHSGPDQAPPTWPEAAHLCNSWSWPGPPLEACLNSGFRVRLLPFWVLHVEKLIKPGRVKESHPDEHVGMACFTGDCASFSPSLRKAGSRLVSTALTLTFRGAHCPLPPVHVSRHTAAPIRVHRGRQQVAAGRSHPWKFELSGGREGVQIILLVKEPSVMRYMPSPQEAM